jgi:hypothetical protein
MEAVYFSEMFFFSFLGWGETESLGTAATVWHIVPALDDRWWWVWSSRWNENWQGKTKYSEKTCPSATLSTTIPTWPDLGSNPGRRGGKPATNRLSYGTALLRNVCSHLQDYTGSQPRRRHSVHSSPWNPQNLLKLSLLITQTRKWTMLLP